MADTVLTTLFDIGWPGAPHRVIRNRVVREWEAAGSPPPGRRPGEGALVGRVTIAGHVMDVPCYCVVVALPGLEGDPDSFCLYAGESCERVNDIRPAAEILAALVREAAGA